jgi:hypothetical protein
MLGRVDALEPALRHADACVAGLAAEVVAAAPAASEDRARAAALVDGVARDRIVATSRLSRAAWLAALDDASLDRSVLLAEALRAPGPPAPAAVWPVDPALDARFDALAYGVEAHELAAIEGLPSEVMTARRTLQILSRAEGDAPPWVQAVVDAARVHDDGTIARLGLVVAGRFGNVACHCEALIREDPSPHLRAAALSAWAAEGVAPDVLATTRLDVLTEDPSPTVRLEAASLAGAPWSADARQAVLAAERWPEVRHALLETWLAEQGSDALATYLAEAPAVDVAAIALAIRRQAEPASAAMLPVAARDDLDAITVGRLVAAMIPDAEPRPDERALLDALAALHSAHPDARVRRAMLDALAGAPAWQRQRAHAATADPDGRVRTQAQRILAPADAAP